MNNLAPLPFVVTPDDAESISGFLHRVATANLVTVSSLTGALGMVNRRRMRPLDTAAIAWITHAPRAWIDWRVPARGATDGRVEWRLFGRSWGTGWSIRQVRQQVCFACLSSRGIARFEWDLACYCACPLHGTLLADHCSHCGRSIASNRATLDVCRCKHYLASSRSAPALADPLLLQWSAWIGESIRPSAPGSSRLPDFLERLIGGMSVDGASRFVVAFGGGSRALARARAEAVESWLPTRQMAAVLLAGLRNLVDWLGGERRLSRLEPIGIEDLHPMPAYGLTEVDRGRAIWLLDHLGVAIPPSVQKSMSRQMPLF